MKSVNYVFVCFLQHSNVKIHSIDLPICSVLNK